MNGLGRWVSRMLSEGGGDPSTKRVLFAFVVISVVAFSAGVVVSERTLGAFTTDLLKTALYATAGAYIGGRYAESREAQP